MTEDGKGHHIDTYSELPHTWVWVTLGSLVLSMKNGIYKPASAYSADGIPCLRMYNIADGRVIWRDIKRMRLSDKEVTDYELRPGDIIVNRVNSRELVGKSAVIVESTERSVFESKNIRVRVNTALAVPEFLNYRLLFARRAYFAQNAQQVVGMASISQPQVAGFPVPLPPLNEQHRIVSEIERRFSILDAAEEALKQVQAKLKRYRASVLQAACTGQLVPTELELARSQDRDYEPADSLIARACRSRGNTRDSTHQQHTQVPNAPEGWTWTTLEQICESSRYGSSAKTSDDSRGIPVLRMGNIQEGQIDQRLLKYLPEKHHEFPILLLRKGDLLFNRTNSAELVGKSAVYEGNPSPCSYASYLIAVRLFSACLPHYLCYFINSPAGRAWVKTVVSQQVGQANVNGSKLRSLMVPLPPIAEQERIVLEVERQMSLVRQTEAAVTANLKRAGRLRQSILKQAFAGTLVPQDPADESASRLLERIGAKRTTSNGRDRQSGRSSVPICQPAVEPEQSSNTIEE